MKMAKMLSLLKVKRNHFNSISQLRFMAAPYTTLVGSPNFNNDIATPNTARVTTKTTTKCKPPNRIFPIASLSTSTTSHRTQNKDLLAVGTSTGNCNPCIDLFFIGKGTVTDSCAYLKKLLPLAWSHNPLTTLKIISFLHKGYHLDVFCTAVYWLHHNHPKTLLCNIPYIHVGSDDCLSSTVQILYCVLQGNDGREGSEEALRKTIKKGVELYERDPDYRLLHDRVTEFYVECLKSDLEKLKNQELKQSDVNIEFDVGAFDDDDDNFQNITDAARICLSPDQEEARAPDVQKEARAIAATFLCESIARKAFPRESYPEYQGVEEADYMKRVRDRLRKEFLVPLDKYSNRFKKLNGIKRGREDAGKYFKEVKAGKSKMVADALLPHEIVNYASNWSVGEVAELQWKAMVEDMKKQGKMKSFLPVLCDRDHSLVGDWGVEMMMSVWTALTLLVSELNEEPWKGKVISGGELNLIEGADLRYKCNFVQQLHRTGGRVDQIFQEVFDLVLQVAVNESLKPEHMIKKVFVFSHEYNLEIHQLEDSSWEAKYKAIQSEYEEKGYGDVVPHIVYWKSLYFYSTLSDRPQIPYTLPGVTILPCFSEDLLKLFLDNGGEIDPEHIMELAISSKEYPSLSVVD